MSQCYTEHDFVYIARSSENDDYTDSFLEYYMCIGCGKEMQVQHEAGRGWIL